MKFKKSLTLGALSVVAIAAPIATVVSCGAKKTLTITIDYTKGVAAATKKMTEDMQKYTQEIKDGNYSTVTFKIITKNGTKEFKFDEDNGQQAAKEMGEFIMKAVTQTP